MTQPFSSSSHNRVMLGFVVRRCARDLGHPPTALEFAEWANSREENGRRYCLFGRAISASTAEVMLRHPGRLVTVRAEAVVRGPDFPRALIQKRR